MAISLELLYDLPLWWLGFLWRRQLCWFFGVAKSLVKWVMVPWPIAQDVVIFDMISISMTCAFGFVTVQRQSAKVTGGIVKNMYAIWYHISGSTISTLLDGKINPKDWQVLSLGDAGFLQFFRVVSSDYGKPRIYKYTIRQALDSYSIQYIRVVDPMIGQRTTSQRSGGDLLLQPLVEPCGTYPCKAGIFTWIQTIRHGSDCSCGAGNEYFGYSNWLMVSCLIAVDELIALKQIRITLTKMWRHDTGTSEELNFSTLKEFSMRLRGWSLIQKRWRLEVLSFFRITLSTLEVPSRQTMPAQRLLPWWSRSVLGNENTTHFEGCLGSWK